MTSDGLHPPTFFPTGTPEVPGAALTHYKRTLAGYATAGPARDPWPRWRAEVANLGLLSRAVGELADRGVAGLTVEIPAVDRSETETEIADEGLLVEALARLRRKLAAPPDGRPAFGLDVVLSTGRPYVPPPPALDISTNDLCGLKCVMCGNRNARRDPATMSPEDVAGLIREAAAWGIGRIALTGAGEPFRDPAILDHLDLTQSLGQLVTITTNGFPVTEALAERLAAARASISVSIHGALDSTQDTLTGVATSGVRAWAAVDRLVAARDRAGTRGRFSVNVSTVIQRGNLAEIPDLVRRSRAAGVDGHNLQPVNLQHGRFTHGGHGPGPGVERRDDAARIAELWPTAEQGPLLDQVFAELVALRRDGPGASPHLRVPEDRLALFRRYFADPRPGPLGVSCRVGESFLGVDHRGAIKPCYRLPWRLGDARLVSVRRFWNSRAYAGIRRVIRDCPLTCMNNCFFRA